MTNKAQDTASFRQLARLIGVSEKAVRKAKTAGVFSHLSVGRDGSGAPVVLDLSMAVMEWEKSGRSLRAPLPRRSSSSSSAPVAAPTPAAGAGGRDDSDEPSVTPGESAQPDMVPLDAPPSLVNAQIAAMKERARKLRLENDQREELLIDVTEASREAFEFARVLRESIFNVPARISAELAAESDASRVFARLDAALREALESTAVTLDVPPLETATA
ncbi:MAG: hypothetical protein A3H96_11425 [Acidobacteria bacterium RIFCSPLOWO2_02_FULL_67_36]|nr:MAG: hypothetical protein A3H96_11425 [Acidobacteria bacterium RIFCSPLOWO2_02_FULL_67_36]OGA76296.1 MAG: hypothetical protein A3G27_05790 [Betaproteobacteria bacterium RIFCSPLOWO2_12_FULL_66_14]